MRTLSLRLPESLHRQLRDLAERDGVSVNPFITTAVAEKLSALMTAESLEQHAARGDRGQFDRGLARVLDVPIGPVNRINDNQETIPEPPLCSCDAPVYVKYPAPVPAAITPVRHSPGD